MERLSLPPSGGESSVSYCFHLMLCSIYFSFQSHRTSPLSILRRTHFLSQVASVHQRLLETSFSIEMKLVTDRCNSKTWSFTLFSLLYRVRRDLPDSRLARTWWKHTTQDSPDALLWILSTKLGHRSIATQCAQRTLVSKRSTKPRTLFKSSTRTHRRSYGRHDCGHRRCEDLMEQEVDSYGWAGQMQGWSFPFRNYRTVRQSH